MTMPHRKHRSFRHVLQRCISLRIPVAVLRWCLSKTSRSYQSILFFDPLPLRPGRVGCRILLRLDSWGSRPRGGVDSLRGTHRLRGHRGGGHSSLVPLTLTTAPTQSPHTHEPSSETMMVISSSSDWRNFLSSSFPVMVARLCEVSGFFQNRTMAIGAMSRPRRIERVRVRLFHRRYRMRILRDSFR